MNKILYQVHVTKSKQQIQVRRRQMIMIDDNDICGIIEGVHRMDKFDLYFDIGLISECKYDENSSENEEKSNRQSNNEDSDEI